MHGLLMYPSASVSWCAQIESQSQLSDRDRSVGCERDWQSRPQPSELRGGDRYEGVTPVCIPHGESVPLTRWELSEWSGDDLQLTRCKSGVGGAEWGSASATYAYR